MSVWDRLKNYGSKGPQARSQPITLLPAKEFEAQVTADLDQSLSRIGVLKLAKRRWGKEWAPEINALVELEPLKGAFTAAWGISLPFVPHLTDDFAVDWHRTLRSARFDLSFHPRDYEEDRSAWAVGQLSTRDELAAESPSFAAQVAKGAEAFLKPLTTLDALPAAYAAKRDRPFVKFGLKNYPQEMLAYAFVLARCGRRAEAEEQMRSYWARLREFDDGSKIPASIEDELNRLLSKTLAG
jgi:hypothetical protein